MISYVSIAVDEQMSVGSSGRMDKEERWMNERGGEEVDIGSGTSVLYEYQCC